MRGPLARSVRSAEFVAMNGVHSLLRVRHSSHYNSSVPSYGLAHFVTVKTKEGGWNRKIHRATEPAIYAPSSGSAMSAPTAAGRITGGAPIAQT
jgi:hypothetical protein